MSEVDLGALYERERGSLWGLAYRMTGSANDADDLVQEAFTRAIERPPADPRRPWGPWLATVTLNLSRDQLRERQRRSYTGEWLPSPVPSEVLVERDARWGDPAGRYALRESVGYAFLLALEVLTPSQRAVLILRDVFDHSVRDTAEALELTEANVKTTLHRARKAMEPYDQARRPPSVEEGAAVEEALTRLFGALGAGDSETLLALLAEDVVSKSDGGGQFVSALKPIRGRDAVARFLLGLAGRLSGDFELTALEVNGLPALLLVLPEPPPNVAPRQLVRCDLDAEGRVGALYGVMASDKLSEL